MRCKAPADADADAVCRSVLRVAQYAVARYAVAIIDDAGAIVSFRYAPMFTPAFRAAAIRVQMRADYRGAARQGPMRLCGDARDAATAYWFAIPWCLFTSPFFFAGYTVIPRTLLSGDTYSLIPALW